MIEALHNPRGSILPVFAKPGARQDAVLGPLGRVLRVAVRAAPEGGKANQAIVAVLADALGVHRSRVVQLSGRTSPRKRFLIEGVPPDELLARLRLTPATTGPAG